jgi:lysozyme
MFVTKEGLALIREFEGFRSSAYRCPAGILTIGYGHTSAAGPPEVKPGMRLSREEAEQVLAGDVGRTAGEVKDLLVRELTPPQFSALVSLAFNVGIGAFARSSVLKSANAGQFGIVPQKLLLWTKGGGRVLPGLVRRRNAEAALFSSKDVSA